MKSNHAIAETCQRIKPLDEGAMAGNPGIAVEGVAAYLASRAAGCR